MMSKKFSAITLAIVACVLSSSVGAQNKAAPPADEKPAAAAPATPEIPWMVNCASTAGNMACEATQRLVLQSTGQLLLSVTVNARGKSDAGAMMVHLPHGLFLPSGVSLDVDGKGTKKEAVQTCDPQGCYVGLALEGDFLKSLQSGKVMTIAFQNLQKRDVKVPITLSGFGEAYEKLKQ